MKTYELLREAADNPFDAIKAMNREFKEMAADVELSLVAGMGWPNINQKGGWFGGGLGSKGGNNKKNVDSLTLPVEIRRKAFLKALAQKLEKLMDEGREIEIGQGASRAVHSEKGIKGHIFDQLMKNMVIDKPPGNIDRERMPCLVWFVGLGGDLAGKTPFRVTGNFYGQPPPGQEYGGPHLYIDVGGTIETAEGRKLHTALNKFRKVHGEWSSWDEKTNKHVRHENTAKWHAFIREMGQIMSKIVDKPLPADFDGTAKGYFSIDRKALSSSTQRLTPEQLDLIVSAMRKHCK
jgi:hypothetical protein